MRHSYSDRSPGSGKVGPEKVAIYGKSYGRKAARLEQFAYQIGTILSVPGLVPGFLDGDKWASILVEDLILWHGVHADARREWAKNHPEEITRILVFDAIIGNTDRHVMNIGIDSLDGPIVFDHDLILSQPGSPSRGFFGFPVIEEVQPDLLRTVLNEALTRLTPSLVHALFPYDVVDEWQLGSAENVLDRGRIGEHLRQILPANRHAALAKWRREALPLAA